MIERGTILSLFFILKRDLVVGKHNDDDDDDDGDDVDNPKEFFDVGVNIDLAATDVNDAIIVITHRTIVKD
jgi:hypothetical protein